ncbi:MAG: 2-oxoacid:ferredoxin oxidoreductase subunit gamma [Candidatus Coatesbacteria bacterium]|nr:MAG: 2-oxoacid:ferredoxin oxidoreductase subunit gamma [Candidatus Coatesbacteria bacterium]HDM59106.1 2-oxoacid:ferredoxin oxidoreductase subunit gamma [Bacillota bacterium]
MTTELIVAGFGGQGVLLFGKFLALSGLKEGKEVVWIPSYGPEMRGGTCNCTVVVSEDPIGSPIIDSPNTVVVMNKPSLAKFGPRVSPDGLLLINSSLIDTTSDRTDIRIETVPANDIALELGNGKAANMVALGAYVALTKVVKFDTILDVVKENFAKKKEFLDLNIRAVKKGYELAS